MADSRFALELLPYTLLFEIEKHLSVAEMANVAMACQLTLMQVKRLDQHGYFDKSLGINYSDITLHAFFNSRIHAMQKNLQQPGLCILTGKKDDALAKIDKNKDLLCHVISAITLKKHPSHVGEKHVGRTLFQLALATYDYEVYGEIGQRIQLKYGYSVMAQQFNEQFPDGVRSKKSYRAVFDALIITVAADATIDFVDGQNVMNNMTREALLALKNSLTRHQYTTGMHFDLQIVMDLIDAYKEGKDEFKNKEKERAQRALYWRCGFGLLESFMPYFIAMALNDRQDFFAVMKGEMKVNRSTIIAADSDFFDPFLGVSRYFLAACPSAMLTLADRCIPSFEAFVVRTQETLDNLAAEIAAANTLTYTK